MQVTCPHCQTVFKVSDENLSVADGFVRCGICKEVFNAIEKDLLINKKASLVQTKTASTAETPAKKTIKSNEKDPVEFILEQSQEVSTSKNQNNLSASDKPSNQKDKTTSTRPEAQSNLIKPPLVTKKPEPVSTSAKVTPANTEITQQIKPEAISTSTKATPANTEITQQIKPEAISTSTKATPANTEITQQIKPEALDTRPPVSKTKPTVTASATPSTASAAKTDSITAAPNKAASNNLFDGVQSKLIPDEYRIPVLHNTYSIWKDLAWSLAILVLTASLFVEYTWFNRNDLISNPQLRPLVIQFCRIADCGPMDLRDPGKIEMTTRNIYTHPNVKNALMISGTLINHAQFEQPYPNILIDFSNVRGEVTASRIFTPEDYLQIKLNSLKPLASNVSIDFTIEIKDPGSNAMTYEFSFL